MGHNFTGTVYGEPELRYTPTGKAVLQLTVAESIGRDKPRNWYHVEVWEQPAENAAQSLHDGAFVMVDARLRTDTWEDKQTGEKRSRQIYTADEIGYSLRFHTVTAQSTRGHQTSRPATAASTPPAQQTPAATPQAGWAPQASTDPERPF